MGEAALTEIEILAPKTDDIPGAVWLATAIMTYDATRRETTPPTAPDITFRQADIVRLAGRLARGAVDPARVSQHTNGDHNASSRNYLRAVGAGRRLASASDFGGERTIPWELHPYDVAVVRWKTPPETLKFGEIIDWVLNVYSDWALTFPGASTDQATRAAEPPSASFIPQRPSRANAVVQASRDGFSLDSVFGKIEFIHAPLRFADATYQDAFAGLHTSITLGAVLAKPRYASLRRDIEGTHAAALDAPLAEFLAERKRERDPMYTRFLNEWGDRTYRRFWLEAPEVAHHRGVYAFATKGVVKYIGRSRDPFRRRIEQGYGYIAPRACFLDGQGTNCKVNSFVAAAWPDVAYFVHVESDEERLMRLEEDLIAKYAPEWNARGV